MRQFYKYSGTGNDFIIFNELTVANSRLSKDKIIELCSRRKGIGADGIVYISPSEKADFKMTIYNADATEAEMCGNASRCCIDLLHKENPNKKNYKFETFNGLYEGSVDENQSILIQMTELYDVDAIDISDFANMSCMYLNTGVPHAVIEVNGVEDFNVKKIGAVIRNDMRFKNGTNVDFFEVLNEKTQTLKYRVYERGVEDETLCCGTGVVATAVAVSKKLGWSGEIKFHSPGGIVSAIIDDEKVFLKGPVDLVFKGEINLG